MAEGLVILGKGQETILLFLLLTNYIGTYMEIYHEYWHYILHDHSQYRSLQRFEVKIARSHQP